MERTAGSQGPAPSTSSTSSSDEDSLVTGRRRHTLRAVGEYKTDCYCGHWARVCNHHVGPLLGALHAVAQRQELGTEAFGLNMKRDISFLRSGCGKSTTLSRKTGSTGICHKGLGGKALGGTSSWTGGGLMILCMATSHAVNHKNGEIHSRLQKQSFPGMCIRSRTTCGKKLAIRHQRRKCDLRRDPRNIADGRGQTRMQESRPAVLIHSFSAHPSPSSDTPT